MNKSVIEYQDKYFEQVVKLLADFRVLLRSFKDIESEPDIESAKVELKEYIDEKYPLYLALIDDKVVGYVLLRVHYVVWVEHIFVAKEYRRLGVGSLLYDKAEEYSTNLKNDTMFNYVHPNNNTMIDFLKSKGYSVINLIEIRKPFDGETNNKKIKVGENEFDY